MSFFGDEEILKKLEKMEELEKTDDSLSTEGKINFGAGIANLVLAGAGVLFFPLSIVSIGASVGLFFHRRHLNKKKQELREEYFDATIDLKKYTDQMDLIKKLFKPIGEHYKKTFQGEKYIKEKEICKHIKLNSPQQMDSRLLGQLKIQAQKLVKEQKSSHYNILVLGRSGVGKSTLINEVLQLKGDKAAKESAVKPETGSDNLPAPSPNKMETSLIIVEKKKFVPIEYGSEKSSLVLLDSRGIEMSKKYNIDIAAEDIKNFIEERNGLESDPDKFIHCIWYLVCGKRFEDDEGKYVQSLKSLYTNFGLPIIFVYTQAISEEDGDLIQGRIEEFMGEKINFTQIIARDMEVKTKKKKTKIEAYGLFEKEDGLIKQSFDLAKISIKSSYFNYMKNLLKNIFVNLINVKAYLSAHIFIADKIHQVIKDKRPLEEVRNSFENEFLEIIKLFLIDKEIPEYTKKNRILIKEYFNCFPNLKDPKLLSLVDELREKETDKLVGDYMDLNLKAEKDLGVSKMKGKDDIKNMLNKDLIEPLKNRIPYLALSYILLKYMGMLGQYLNDKLSNDFEESYKRIENETSKELKTIIENVYDNIMNNSGINFI